MLPLRGPTGQPLPARKRGEVGRGVSRNMPRRLEARTCYFVPSERSAADALHPPDCRIAALPAPVGVLDGDARAGGIVVARALPLLRIAAGRTSSRACDRP